MTFRLSEVRLGSGWREFLLTLPGWAEEKPGFWHGAGAAVQIDHERRETVATIDLEGPGGGARLQLERTGITQIAGAAERPAYSQDAEAVLNHLAIDVPEASTAIATLLCASDARCMLPKAARFDPSVGKMVVAEHLVGLDGEYITLRYLPALASPCLSHIGFQFATENAFLAHQLLLMELGWPILVGPEVIDGSLLVHFEGPDGLVHDLFHVLRSDEAIQ